METQTQNKESSLKGKLVAGAIKLFPKLLKMTKFIKFGLAAVTFASYTAVYTWKFALLLMIGIGWHEFGHVWAMKHKGLKTKGFFFLPFIGGAAILEEKVKTYWDHVFIAMMGPIFGLGMTTVALGLYFVTGLPWLAGAASWMAFVNLFNLFPVSPLDGGHVAKAIAFSFHTKVGKIFTVFSFIVSMILAFKLGLGLLFFFIIIGTLDLVYELFIRRNADISDYPEQMNGQKILYTSALYLMTVGALIALVLMSAHIPGADLAANFLKD